MNFFRTGKKRRSGHRFLPSERLFIPGRQLTHVGAESFCEKGEGGKFVSDGNLISGVGRLPINTDGGGLNNNHPASRGGIVKVIEAVRQLREEAHPQVQVRNCDLALVHGTGGGLSSRHGSATLVLERV